MLRVVVDTNVLISGFIWRGMPQKCLDKFRYEANYQLLLSPEIVHEFRSKLLDKFQVEPKIVKSWVAEIGRYAEKILPIYTIKICRDPKDDIILGTAKSARADLIVTGDKDLLKLKNFQGIKIVTPKVFLKIIEK